jgi:hypothetical protein
MNKVKIFLASSAELDADKEKFEIFVSKKNKALQDQRIFLELVTWKDFISAISNEHSQEKYNDYIRSCDIAVFLFHTRFGQFTREEFEHAHQAFLSCKHRAKTPLIYTYFKIDNNETPEVTEFKNYIDDLGHFYDTYENLDDLIVKFNGQLDILEQKEIIIIPEKIDTSRIIKYAVYYFLLPLLVLSGAFFSFYYFQPTDMTVKVAEVRSIPNLPFQQGNITLTYGDKTETQIITGNEIIFKQIPSKYKNDRLKLYFKAQGFEPVDTLIGVNDLVILPIKRDNSLGVIFGYIYDEVNMLPIEHVLVKLDNIQTFTDKDGMFKISIPWVDQAFDKRISVYKEGFKSYDKWGTPSNKDAWRLILEKK